jgi:hypothetical protein
MYLTAQYAQKSPTNSFTGQELASFKRSPIRVFLFIMGLIETCHSLVAFVLDPAYLWGIGLRHLYFEQDSLKILSLLVRVRHRRVYTLKPGIVAFDLDHFCTLEILALNVKTRNLTHLELLSSHFFTISTILPLFVCCLPSSLFLLPGKSFIA